MGFQQSVGVQPAPAVAGDFASANPRSSVLAGPGGIVAGAGGCFVGRFAWLSYSAVDGNSAPAAANNNGFGPVAGFVHRHQQGLLTDFLQEASMKIPAGFAMALMSSGDYWAVNSGLIAAAKGDTVYANFADGLASPAAAAAVTFTGEIAAGAGSVTASISGDVMTVTAVGSGTLPVGALLSGAGVVSGTRILAQLTGTPLGIGTYRVSELQTVASTTVTAAFGVLTASAVTGTIGVGQALTGTGVVAGSYITALGSGTGGAGTYIVNDATVVASTAMTGATNVATKWRVMSPALPGELMKISTWVEG